MSDSTRFWDKIAVRYSKQPISDEAAYEKKLAVTREYFTPDSEVLEFGCGTGSTAILHAPHVKHILATDISPKMIEIAEDRAKAGSIENVTFEATSIEALDAPDGSFDVVLGLSILHLLEDMDAAIEKIVRLLKPGGVFISSTVCIGEKMKWIRFIAPIGRALGLMPFVRVFMKSDLEESLQAAGLTIEYNWQPDAGMVVFIVARNAD